jgi:hypothetical protein
LQYEESNESEGLTTLTTMSTPGAAEAMAHDGVLAEPLVLLVEA